MKSLQRGISLLELMLSIIVISALLLLATRYYQQTRENMRVAQAIEMINTVTQASYKWLEGNPDFPNNDLIPSLVNLSLLPSTFFPSDGSRNINPWKGTIKAEKYTIDKGAYAGSYIRITLSNVPRKSCTNLQEKLKDRVISKDSVKNDPGAWCEPADNNIQNFYAIF